MQNVRKLVVLIGVAFGVAVIAACVLLFSVKKVSVEFSVYGESQATEIREDLETFNGRNILFVKVSDVYAVCDKYPYYEITAVKKEYPNVLKVNVKKRAEKFRLTADNGVFVLDGEGIVLNDTGVTEIAANVIDLNAGDLTVVAEVGKKITTSDDGLFFAVITSAQTLNISDCVKNISIDKLNVGGTDFRRDAVFETHTGVKVTVEDVDDDGAAKINAAFIKYESLSDYEKTVKDIIAYKSGGEIVAVWTSHYSG